MDETMNSISNTICAECGLSKDSVSNVHWAGSAENADPTPLCDECKTKAGIQCLECYDSGDPCMGCCPHDERDHGICLDCGHEEDPGAAIDRAMDYGEDR